MFNNLTTDKATSPLLSKSSSLGKAAPAIAPIEPVTMGVLIELSAVENVIVPGNGVVRCREGGVHRLHSASRRGGLATITGTGTGSTGTRYLVLPRFLINYCLKSNLGRFNATLKNAQEPRNTEISR